MIEPVAEAGVAVVESHHAKAVFHQQVDQFVGPAGELHAQAHHEQHHGRVARALVVHFQHQAVGAHLHVIDLS